MFVKPAEGLAVRDPLTKRVLPIEGKEVPETSYWVRRVASGDVVEVQAVTMIPEHQAELGDDEVEP